MVEAEGKCESQRCEEGRGNRLSFTQITTLAGARYLWREAMIAVVFRCSVPVPESPDRSREGSASQYGSLAGPFVPAVFAHEPPWKEVAMA